MHNNSTTLFLIRKTALFLFFSLLAVIARGENADTLFLEKYNKTIYYNSDTIFSNYCEKGFNKVIGDLYEYYEDVFWNMPQNTQQSEIQKMRNIAESYDNKELDKEAELMEALSLPEENEPEIKHKIKRIQSIVESDCEDNPSVKIRGIESIFDIYWRSMKYAKAFSQIHLLDKALQDTVYKDFPDIGNFYFRIGEAYFFFQDYEKAIPYLRKAMKPSKFYCDRANLKATNTLGTYHNLKGNIDSAEYYFRKAYNSRDMVKSRSMYDAIALGNLGHSLVQRKKYNEAIPYFQAGLDRMLIDFDYKRASDATLGLARCYFGKGDLKAAKQMIDSSLVYVERSDNVNLYRLLYPLMSKYHSKIGNKELADAYLDSTILASNRYMEKYNSRHILRAEQELFETASTAKDEELRYQREKYNDRIFYGSICIAIISLGLVFFIILYRKNRKAYRALVQKNQDWAGAEIPVVFEPAEIDITDTDSLPAEEDITNQPDEEDIKLMQQVTELIKKDKIFKDLDLTLDSLSKQMNINRNYLSKAINKTTGKNFNTYINEYRIKEAIKIMSDKKSDLISIDAIALEVGFGNRTSFYQSFKKITGLSPSDFRNNKSPSSK